MVAEHHDADRSGKQSRRRDVGTRKWPHRLAKRRCEKQSRPDGTESQADDDHREARRATSIAVAPHQGHRRESQRDACEPELPPLEIDQRDE